MGVGRSSATQTVRSCGACSATWSGSRVASATSANHVFHTLASDGMFSCSHASRSSLTHTSVEPVVRLWPCATSCWSLSASSVTASDESECARRASHRACVAETRRGLGIRCPQRTDSVRFVYTMVSTRLGHAWNHFYHCSIMQDIASCKGLFGPHPPLSSPRPALTT